MGVPNSKPDKISVLNFLNNVSSEAFLTILNECALAVEDTQTIRLKCQPNTDLGKQEDSESCVECLQSIYHTFESQALIQRTVWAKGGALDVVKPIDTQFNENAEAIKACRFFCKTCNFSNISQKAYLNVQQNCKINEQSIAAWQNKIKGTVQEQLYSRSDLGASLLSTVKNSNKDQTYLTMANTVANRLDTNLANILVNNITASQTVTLTSDTAANFQGIHQDVLVTKVATLMGDSQVFDNVLTDEQWDSWGSVWTEDSTLDSLGNVLLDTTQSLADVLSSTIGALVFGLMILTGVLLFAVIILVGLKVSRDKA